METLNILFIIFLFIIFSEIIAYSDLAAKKMCIFLLNLSSSVAVNTFTLLFVRTKTDDGAYLWEILLENMNFSSQ